MDDTHGLVAILHQQVFPPPPVAYVLVFVCKVWEVHRENEGLLAVRKRVRKEVVTLQHEEDELRRVLGLPPARSELAPPTPTPLPPLPEPVAAAPPARKKSRAANRKRATQPVQQRPRVSTPPPSPTPVGTAPSLPASPPAKLPLSLPCPSLERHPAAESHSNRVVAGSSSPGSALALHGDGDKDVLLGSPLSLPVPSSPANSFDLASGENDDIAKLLLGFDDTAAAGDGNHSANTTAAAGGRRGGGGGGGIRDPGTAHREAEANTPSSGVAPSSVWRGSPSRGHSDGKTPPSRGKHTAVRRRPPPAGGLDIGGLGPAVGSARPAVVGVGGVRGQQPNSGRGGTALRGGRGGRGPSGGRGGVKKKTNYFDPNAPVKRRASGRGGASSRGILGSRGGRSGGRAVVGVPTGSRGALGVGGGLGNVLMSVVQRQPVEEVAAGAIRPAGTSSTATAGLPDGNKRPPGL